MARAYLNILDEVKEAFTQAQDSRSTRMLIVKIEEERMILANQIERIGTAEEDFNSILREPLEENQAAFVLYCLTDNPQDALQWILIAWIPDTCPVRDKMLYSSSREDLKQSLGLGFFKTDYAANIFDELTWEQYKDSMNKEVDEEALTETERCIKEEHTLSRVESMRTKSSALTVLPFDLSDDLIPKLNSFKAGEFNWLEMTMEGEVISVVRSAEVNQNESFQSLVSEEHASFIAIRLKKISGDNINVLIFSCPENVPVRSKMTMSSSKVSVISLANENGIDFDKSLEIRGPDEIDDLLKHEIDPTVFESAVAAAGGASSAASISHSKPSRPGRGKAKVAKFKPDDN